MKNIIIVFFMLIALSIYPETELIEATTDVEVWGYGIGKGANPQIAMTKANDSARVNLAEQIESSSFEYISEGDEIIMITSISAFLEDTKIIETVQIGDKEWVSIASTQAKIKLPKDISLNYKEYSKTLKGKDKKNFNFQFSFNELRKTAILDYIKENYKDASNITGKCFVKDITLKIDKKSALISAKYAVIID